MENGIRKDSTAHQPVYKVLHLLLSSVRVVSDSKVQCSGDMSKDKTAVDSLTGKYISFLQWEIINGLHKEKW